MCGPALWDCLARALPTILTPTLRHFAPRRAAPRFAAPHRAAPRRATSQLNTCQSSQDGKAGLEYACLKEGASVMQLSCPSDKRCAGNGSGGGCALNVYNSGQCIKSTSSNKFVQVKCAARQGGVFAPPPS